MLHLGLSDGVTLHTNCATLHFYSEFMCNALWTQETPIEVASISIALRLLAQKRS